MIIAILDDFLDEFVATMLTSTGIIMCEQAKINTLSSAQPGIREGVAVVMVGSFAPVHKGHFDAVHAASTALAGQGNLVESVVLTPNSAEYVERKLPEDHGEWTYERRIHEILGRSPHPHIPTYVDDVSGRLARHEQINGYVPVTMRRYLGFTACQTYLVVGSDQLLSMESHLENERNRAVCVLRPGSLDYARDRLDLPWIAAAVEEGRFVITERENMKTDISSTAVRRSLVAG